MVGVEFHDYDESRYDMNLGRMVTPELGLKAGYTLIEAGSEPAPTIYGHMVSIDGAYEVLNSQSSKVTISACPIVGLAYGSIQGSRELFIPFGGALGFGFLLGHNAVLDAYMSPRAVRNRSRLPSNNGQVSSGIAWGFLGGANLLIDRFVVGARLSGEGDTFGVVGGLTF
ncbi:MAG: hypothetical protein LBG44_09685 [Gemmatimonadota bacterium]|jgi:hypothetical protein|nr:hypothetical protein [Gemmatimonadota bacterium]